MKNVIIDVDTGIDDALAILLAVKSSYLNVLGITTVNGNVSLDIATNNTCKILSLLGDFAKDIPVYRGANQPLIRKAVYEYSIHGENGLGGAEIDLPINDPEEMFAADYIIKEVMKNKHNITLIMLAPLTNLALAISIEPKIVDYIDEVIFMGGVVSGQGNITPTAEFNIYVDPEAAKIVVQSGLALTMVGLDVTMKVLLDEDHIERLKGSDLHGFVKNSTKHYLDRYEEANGIRACAMHDPLAIAVAIEHSIVHKESYFVDVETNSDLCDGQTVCDFDGVLNKEANMDVCIEVDSKRFFNLFINTLLQVNGQ